MKQAVGEANLTIITIILMGTILPVFYFVIPRITNSMQDKACCLQNEGTIQYNKDSGKTVCRIFWASEKFMYYEISGFRKYCK